MHKISEAELKQSLEKGMKIWEVMTSFNCSRNTVINTMKNHQIATPKGFFSTGKKVGRPKGTKQHPDVIKQMKLRVQGENNPFHGKKHDTATKRKMSENHADFKGDNNPYRNFLKKHPEARKAASKRTKAQWDRMSPEEKSAHKTKLSLAITNSNYHRNFSSLKSHKKGHLQTKKGGRMFYRSSWEKRFALFLDKQPEVLAFACEPFCIKYQDTTGVTRYTRPDFLISLSDSQWLVEIKPSGLLPHRNNPEKLKAMKKYASDHNIRFSLITEHEMDDLRKEIECHLKN